MNHLIETKVSLVALSYNQVDSRITRRVLLKQDGGEVFWLDVSPEQYDAMRERMHEGVALVLMVMEAEKNEKDQ